jgi:hypothetical protein
MSRRKTLTLTAAWSLLALGLGFSVPMLAPKPVPDPGRILACLDPCGEQASDKAMKSDRRATIQVELRIVSFPIFSDFAKRGQPVCGTVTNLYHLLECVQDIRQAHIKQCPKQTAMSGQAIMTGGLMVRPAIAEDGVSTVQKYYGILAKGTATLRKDGRIHLQVDVSDSLLPDKCLPDVTLRARGSFVLDNQQTAFMGGLTRKNVDRYPYDVPFLSALPGIGSWFSFPREVEFEEELLIFATTEIVSAQE